MCTGNQTKTKIISQRKIMSQTKTKTKGRFPTFNVTIPTRDSLLEIDATSRNQ